MNLGEALEEIYRSMHDDIVNGEATSGTATTILDSALNAKYQQNKFKNWIAFIKKTSNAASPQNKFSVITSFASNPFQATVSPTLTDAVESGDLYSFCKGSVPLRTLIDLFNDGLKRLGRVVEVDYTGITTATDTRRYSLPVTLKGVRPRAVYLIDENYTRLATPSHRIIPAAGGSTETLEFASNPAEGKTVVYKYISIHPKLSIYSDTVNERIHDELAIAAGLERAYWWKCQPKRRKIDLENWGQAKALLQEARMNYPIQMPITENQRVPLDMYNGMRG